MQPGTEGRVLSGYFGLLLYSNTERMSDFPSSTQDAITQDFWSYLTGTPMTIAVYLRWYKLNTQYIPSI
jgi:hypothetical protein